MRLCFLMRSIVWLNYSISCVMVFDHLEYFISCVPFQISFCLSLHIYTASVTSTDVQESVFVDEERTVVDTVVMEYLRQFI